MIRQVERVGASQARERHHDIFVKSRLYSAIIHIAMVQDVDTQKPKEKLLSRRLIKFARSVVAASKMDMKPSELS